MGRFINADAFTSTGQGLLGNNMFAYSLNNPVTLQDSTGHSALLVTLGTMALGGVIGAVANAVAVASNGGSVRDCSLGALAGFIGGFAGTGVAALMVMCPATAPYADVVGRGAATLATDLLTSTFINGKVTKEDLAYAAFDVTSDMMFSTITYYYNPSSDDLSKMIVNTAIDGLTDNVQNELFNQNSFTNRRSRNNSNLAVSNTSTTNTTPAWRYAHQKVGILISAI